MDTISVIYVIPAGELDDGEGVSGTPRCPVTSTVRVSVLVVHEVVVVISIK